MVRAHIEERLCFAGAGGDGNGEAFLLFCQYFMSTESILEIYAASIKYKSIKVNTELKVPKSKEERRLNHSRLGLLSDKTYAYTWLCKDHHYHQARRHHHPS